MQFLNIFMLCTIIQEAVLLKTTVYDSTNDYVDCVDLTKQMNDVKRDLEQVKSMDKPIAFTYELSQSIKPTSGQTVKFDRKHLAIGGGYSPSTGMFIAPVSGLYHFTLGASSIKATKEKLLHLRIMQGNKDKAYVFLDHNDDRWLNHYASALLKLNKGERVYVRVTNVRDNPVLSGNYLHTMFGGHLIQAI